MKTFKFLHILMLFLFLAGLTFQVSAQPETNAKAFPVAELMQTHPNLAQNLTASELENKVIRLTNKKLEESKILYLDENGSATSLALADLLLSGRVSSYKIVTAWRAFDIEFSKGGWNFLIINADKKSTPPGFLLDKINDYLLNGDGKLIMSFPNLSAYANHSLFKTLGIQSVSDQNELKTLELSDNSFREKIESLCGKSVPGASQSLEVNGIEINAIHGSTILADFAGVQVTSPAILQNPMKNAIFNNFSINADEGSLLNNLLKAQMEHLSGGRWSSQCETASYMSNLSFYYVGTFEYSDDEAWFYFELSDYTEDVTVSLCNSTFDTQLSVYDECDGNVLGYNDNGDCDLKNPEVALQSKIDFDYLDAGTYYIRIQGNNGETGDYSLKVDAFQNFPSIFLPSTYLYQTLGANQTGQQDFLIINFGGADLDFSFTIDYLNKANRESNIDKPERNPHPITKSIAPAALNKLKEIRQMESTLFFDDMESGLNGWTIQEYTGNSLNDLWHQSNYNYGSYQTSWWCADEMTGNYETGEALSTALISPFIDLTSELGNVYLYFWENFDTEEGWDRCLVDVSTDGGFSWVQMRGDGLSGNSSGWQFSEINLSAFAGQVIQIRFYFDTGDAIGNDYPGWFIDDVFISSDSYSTDWLSLWSFSYTIPPGWGYYVTASFDSNDLLPGTYFANINILSNDPVNPMVVLPVELLVTSESGFSCEEALNYGTVSDPSQYGYLVDNSEVWYRFDVYQTTPGVAVSLCGSDFNTVLQVYSDCYWTLLGENDDADCGFGEDKAASQQSEYIFSNLYPGTYFVKITSGYFGGNYVLSIDQRLNLMPPANLEATLDNQTGEVFLDWNNFSGDYVYEDFEDNIADNFLFSDFRLSVAAGKLRMEGTSSNSWASTYYKDIYTDFSLEFEFTRTESDNTNASTIGAFIRSDGFMSYRYPVNGYIVAFTVSGYYSVWLELNGAEYGVIPWTETPLINTVLGQTNSVLINANGTMIDIYINGNYLNSFTDSNFISGYVNLCTFDSNTGINEVLFDNFELIPYGSESLSGLVKPKQQGGATHSGNAAQCFGQAIQNPYNEPIRLLSESMKSQNRYLTGYNVYRNGFWIASTTESYYYDYLPESGSYYYTVTALYSEGESSHVGPAWVYWENYPDIFAYPFSLEEELMPGQEDAQLLFIHNLGIGQLDFGILLSDGSKSVQSADIPKAGFARKSEGKSSNVQYNEPAISVPVINHSKSPAVNVLVFRDQLAWGFDVNVPILQALGADVSVASSSEMASIDLSPYSVIVFESQQPNSFYQTYSANQTRFANYVSQGGIMFFNAATYTAIRMPEIPFPGGMKTRNTEQLSLYNWVNNPTHPIVAGTPSPYYTMYSSHESFENVPPGASILTIDEWNNPTLVEYTHGNGRVIATGLTLEFGYALGENYSNVLINEFKYALELAGNFWLKVLPYSGSVPPGNNYPVLVTFSADGLFPGVYNANIDIYSNDPDQPLVTVPVTLTVGGEQMVLSLPQGWSGISTYLYPGNNNVEAMFMPVVSDLIILESTYTIYWPGENVNTMGSWDSHEGYKIKMANAASLNVVGMYIDAKTIYLFAGWNLIPVISECPVNVADFFAGSNVIIVKEVAGVKLYWPAMGINTLGMLQPGKSYYVMMSGFNTLTYPSCSSKNITSSHVSMESESMTDRLMQNLVRTPVTHSIAFPKQVATQFAEGDIISAYDHNGSCYGLVVWQNETTALTIFGDDPTTAVKDGFNPNETIIFKLYRNPTNTEYLLDLTFDAALPNSGEWFADNGISAVKSIDMESTAIQSLISDKQIQVVPNPATDEFVLQLPVEEFSSTRLEIYGIDGQVVKSILLTEKSQKIDIRQLSAGIYVLQIEIDNQKFTKRLVKY